MLVGFALHGPWIVSLNPMWREVQKLTVKAARCFFLALNSGDIRYLVAIRDKTGPGADIRPLMIEKVVEIVRLAVQDRAMCRAMRNQAFAVIVRVKDLCGLAGTTCLLTSALLITPALPQTAQQWKCTSNADIAWDDQIAGCTAAILSEKYAGADRAWAYYNRGNAYRAKGENARAMADYDETIRLDPEDPDSYNARCWTRALAGRDLQGALSDCNESLRLRPNDGNTLNDCGL